MQRHPHFNLWFHDDEELGMLLGCPIEDRVTIHEWPLSSVQRVRTVDKRRHIYKVQAPPTLELEFYAQAKSSLLVEVRPVPSRDTTAAMIMEEISAPRLSDRSLSKGEAISVADAMVGDIANIEGDLPFMVDISTEAGWAGYMGSALDDIQACITEGSFHRVDVDLLHRIRSISESSSVLEAIQRASGYVHSDLKAENILVTADGYRVLDWQRPIKGPTELDVATLLISLGMDALCHVPVGLVQIYYLLRIAWYAQSARRWLPEGKFYLEKNIFANERELQRLT